MRTTTAEPCHVSDFNWENGDQICQSLDHNWNDQYFQTALLIPVGKNWDYTAVNWGMVSVNC
jgi:hypothetical protein